MCVFSNYLYFLFLLKKNVKMYTSTYAPENHFWVNLFLKKQTNLPISDLKVDLSGLDLLNNIYINSIGFYSNKFIYHLISKNMWKFFPKNFSLIWNQRELNEFYGVKSLNSDNRSLLLDYTFNQNPGLKEFPCEGFFEVYYNVGENKTKYIPVNYIEL